MWECSSMVNLFWVLYQPPFLYDTDCLELFHHLLPLLPWVCSATRVLVVSSRPGPHCTMYHRGKNQKLILKSWQLIPRVLNVPIRSNPYILSIVATMPKHLQRSSQFTISVLPLNSLQVFCHCSIWWRTCLIWDLSTCSMKIICRQLIFYCFLNSCCCHTSASRWLETLEAVQVFLDLQDHWTWYGEFIHHSFLLYKLHGRLSVGFCKHSKVNPLILELTWTRGLERADEKVYARSDLQLSLSARKHQCTRTGCCPQLLLQRRWPQAVENYKQVFTAMDNTTMILLQKSIKQ